MPAPSRLAKPPGDGGSGRHEWRFVAALVLAVLVLAATAWLTQRSVVADVQNDLRHKLDAYSAYLESEVQRFALLPEILTAAPDVRQVLAAPGDAATLAAANAYLQSFAEITGASAVYVMDGTGMTLAASNHDTPTSFVGHSYAFRPYFKAAAAGGRGRYVALGSTSYVPGYYLSAPVLANGALAGVVVVKYASEQLVPWQGEADKVLVAGQDGVVFSANDRRLQFSRLGPLTEGGAAVAPDPRQYGDRPLTPIPVHGDSRIGGVRLVTLEPPPYWGEFGSGAQPKEYAVGSRELVGADWRVVVLAEVDGRVRQTLVNALTAVLGLGLVALLASYFSQRRRYMRTLYENAIRDPLTRLYTRLYMNDVVGRMLQGHDRGSISGVALVIFDIDHFKQVNDSFGHYVGDEVLVAVAGIILETVRATDVAVRFGGEEVAVFLPTAKLEDASQFAERIRRRVEATRFPLGETQLAVTLSGGVALHRAGEQLSQLIIRADAALYEAKRAGRNRVISEQATTVAAVTQPSLPL